MRDEVLAEWIGAEAPILNLHLHCSGGIALGLVKWRCKIFKQHLPMVMEALCYGDRDFLINNSYLIKAPIKVYFHAKQKEYERVEQWGTIEDYLRKTFEKNPD